MCSSAGLDPQIVDVRPLDLDLMRLPHDRFDRSLHQDCRVAVFSWASYEPAILNRVDKNVLIYKLLHLYVAQKDLYPGFHNEVEAMCVYDSELSEILSVYHNGMIELTQGLLNQYSGQLEVHDVPIAAVIVNLIASRAAHAVSHGKTAERIMGELVTLLKRYLFFEKG